jgi:hypothetical protein
MPSLADNDPQARSPETIALDHPPGRVRDGIGVAGGGRAVRGGDGRYVELPRGFTRLWSSLLTLGSSGIRFYVLSVTMQAIRASPRTRCGRPE